MYSANSKLFASAARSLEINSSRVPLEVSRREPRSELGTPLGIRQVAELIGCSCWTVRQTLIPRGLPFFRFAACGRMTFYRDQVIAWIQNEQSKNLVISPPRRTLRP